VPACPTETKTSTMAYSSRRADGDHTARHYPLTSQ